MPNRLIRSFFLIAVALTLTACQSLMQKESEKTLQERLKAYEASVRWGYPGQAYNFLEPELAKKSEVPTSLVNIKVTQYKVIQRPNLVAENMAASVVVIGYVHDERQVERSLTDRQLWEYNTESKLWYRTNPIPEFK